MLNKSKFNLTSLYYTIFEGLSKGGTHLLLILIATVISNELYVKIMLFVAFEALITMLYLSYYADVLFSFKKNRSKTFLSVIYDTAIFQFILFILIYLIFKNKIDNYFSYNKVVVFVLLFINGFYTNIIRFYSVSFQLEIKHTNALVYKSIPFLLSFLFSLLFFFFMEDKVLGFFLGKSVGLSFFFFFIFFKNKDYDKIFKSKLLFFFALIKRIKYSLAIAIFGWLAGLGFLNFVKLYLNNQESILILGLIFNFYSILQLFSNGINQVYIPKLKLLAQTNPISLKSYSKKTHLYYIVLSLLFTIICALLITFKSFILHFFPTFNVLLDGNIFFIILIFFLNSFQWISTPYLIIFDMYKEFLYVKLILNLFAWILIFVFVRIGFNDALLYYLLIQIFDSFGLYIFVKLRVPIK